MTTERRATTRVAELVAERGEWMVRSCRRGDLRKCLRCNAIRRINAELATLRGGRDA